jgi:hypothetical protein
MRWEKRLCVCALFFILPPCAHHRGAIFMAAKILVLRASVLRPISLLRTHLWLEQQHRQWEKKRLEKDTSTKAHPNNCVLKRTVRSQNRTQFNKTASLSPLFFYGCGEHKIQHREETPLPKNLAQTPGGMKFWIYDNLCREQISFTAENDCLFNEHTHQVQPFRMLQREFPTHMRLLRDLIYDPRLATILGKSRRRFISNEKSEWLFPGAGVG